MYNIERTDCRDNTVTVRVFNSYDDADDWLAKREQRERRDQGTVVIAQPDQFHVVNPFGLVTTYRITG